LVCWLVSSKFASFEKSSQLIVSRNYRRLQTFPCNIVWLFHQGIAKHQATSVISELDVAQVARLIHKSLIPPPLGRLQHICVRRAHTERHQAKAKNAPQQITK
jgi:hypothetical protein